MVMRRRSRIVRNITVGQHTFEQLENFKCLVVDSNNKDDSPNAIRPRLNAANRGYYVMKKMFSFKLLSEETKKKLDIISYIYAP